MNESVKKPARIFSKKWFWYISGAAAVAAVILILLPYGVKYAVKRVLTDMGTEARIEDVDFNPFTGAVSIYNLESKKGGRVVLSMEEATARFSWLQLFHKRLHLREAAVKGALIKVDELAGEGGGGLRIGGVPLHSTRPGKSTEGEEARSLWGFDLERFTFTEGRIIFSGRAGRPPATLTIKKAVAGGIKNNKNERAYTVEIDGLLNDGAVNLKADVTPFSPTPALSGTLIVKGLSIAPFNPLFEPALKVRGGSLDTDSRVEVLFKKPSMLKYDGALTLKKLRAAASNADISSREFSWKGSVDISLKAGSAGISALRGGAALRGLRIDAPSEKITLLELQKAEFKDIGQLKERAAVKEIRGLGLKIGIPFKEKGAGGGDGKTPLVSIPEINARGVKIKGLKDISISSAAVKKALFLFRRNSAGRWYMVEELLGGKHTGMGFSIALVSMGHKSAVRLVDEKVSPPYELTLNIEEAQIRNIDSKKPGLKSAFTLSGGLARYTKVSLSGAARPFAKKFFLEYRGGIENFDLPPLTPYASEILGYKLTSGHMDAEINGKIEAGGINGTNDLLLKNLTVSPSGSGAVENVMKELSMPLDAFLSLLRDGDNNIHIKVPVSGDAAAPEFSFKDAINRAVLRGIRKSGISYLKYYFQPYGSFITIGEYALKAAGAVARIRLDPVFFPPGGILIAESQTGYLDRVAGLMKERPGIVIKICGIAVRDEAAANGGEGKAADEALSALASIRAGLVKDYLVEKHAIDPGRLFLCNPEIEGEKGSKPRVELLI